eukprot:m.15073 g.15073  ORF g.15073 m.15073 type:complete len:523 (-) comp4952_c0_seq1:861-2429(-)
MSRQNQFKSLKNLSKTADSRRVGRASVNVQLRKDKRADQALKRRNVREVPTFDPDDGDGDYFDPELDAQLRELCAGVYSADAAQHLVHTTKFRRLLSKANHPPIQEVIQTGVVPRFVQFLQCHDNPPLQFEAAWALTNIASGSSEQTGVVVDANAVPYFIELLLSPNDDVREQSVWALGNIAGDKTECRDYVLSRGVMSPLLRLIAEAPKISMVRNATWTLSNLCRGKKPPPNFLIVKESLATLARLIFSHDEEVLTDACWALSYLSDGANEKIQAVIDAGVVRRLVELLLNRNYSVVTPALRTVGNIVTGDDTQTQIVLNCSALHNLGTLLTCPKESIKKEACWTISNVTAGSKEQIQEVIEANLIPPLIYILEHGLFKTRKEAAWAISNATSGGSPEQLRYLVQRGCIKPLCDLLNVQDPKILEVALDALENILKVGEADSRLQGTANEYAYHIEQCGGLERIEFLQSHENDKVYECAFNIIDKFFGPETPAQQQLEPVAQQHQYAFGINQQQQQQPLKF